MAIQTTIARHYFWKQTAMGVLCVVFAVWGAYDLWVRYPAKEERYNRYMEIQEAKTAIEQKQQELEATGQSLTEAERGRYKTLLEDERKLASDGVPLPLSSWDKPTQWLFISCILVAPFCFWAVFQTRGRVYCLDDDGTLHMPEGAWKQEEIAEIDMTRWMSKSMAEIVHIGGQRVLLDDYKHKNLHLIVGAIASRLDPEEWTEDARPRKKVEAEQAALAAAAAQDSQAEDTDGVDDPARDEQRQEA